MYDLPLNSLAQHANPPFQEKQYFANIPLKDFAKVVEGFKSASKPHPETDVLKFYFLNHAFHSLTARYNMFETLPNELAELAEMRTRVTSQICNRVLCHTFLTLLYEMNWLHHAPRHGKYYQDIESRFGKPLADHFSQQGSGGFTLGVMANYKNLDVTCGEYCRALLTTYTTSTHFSAISKDKQWIAISTVPYEFFMGSTSLEGACDKAFSLFHWGGSIFNKDIFYKVNTDTMIHLLDVQDSGQIPQWINENLNNRFVDAELKKAFLAFKKYFPEEATARINQTLVNEATKKRADAAGKIIKQRGYSNGGGGANPQASKDQARPPVQKIDEIVFGSLGLKM